MPALAVIQLKNRTTTNVAFTPSGIDAQGVGRWTTADTVFDSKSVATSSVSLPKNGSSVVRVKQKVVIPVMDPTDPTKKNAEAYVNVEFVLPKSATLAQRQDLLAYAVSLLGTSLTSVAISDFESVY